MTITKGEWRTEAVSDCVRVVVGYGRLKVILARLAPKQLPEAETHANARLMATAPELLALVKGYERFLFNNPGQLTGMVRDKVREVIAKAEAL